MEKRQLDFSAPLLSARRLSSPRKSSELVHRKPVEKRVPPDGPTKPAAVPFNWEQTPGRAKNEPKPKAHFPTTTTPRLPPGWVHSGEAKFDRGPTNPTIYSDHASLIEKLDESLKCKDESENSDAENVEETYSDAINALSLNDSCSVSGVSGNHGTSGRFSVDKQTRDFMMSRFLPAAKAVVVLETPQYAAKKPAVVGPTDEGAVKEVKKKVVYGSAGILRHYGTEDFDGGESEDEEEDGKRGTLVRAKKGAGKSWGIIPRICVKRSLCLLKPIPALKSSSRHPTPTAGEERRLRRNPSSGPLDKNGLQLHPPPKKYHSGLLSHDHRGAHNNSKPSSHDSYPLLSQPSSHESPLRRYRSRSVSPYRNESPRGIPKKIDTEIASSRKMFNALLDVSHRNQATVEKTLYVDSANKTAAQNVRTSSKYADEVKDVKKYLSGGVGLGVKEEMGGFGGSCGPVPPPLLKSPSESWLWRTLPFGQSRRHLSRDGIR